jgi:hypothetical protein
MVAIGKLQLHEASLVNVITALDRDPYGRPVNSMATPGAVTANFAIRSLLYWRSHSVHIMLGARPEKGTLGLRICR